jgi:hypothetical protein
MNSDYVGQHCLGCDPGLVAAPRGCRWLAVDVYENRGTREVTVTDEPPILTSR